MKLLYPIFTIILLPLIALVWIISKVIVPFKNSSQNGMIFLDHEGKRTLFSPYFESEVLLEGTDLLVKTVITLSNEGIKKDLQAPLTRQAETAKKNRAIFRETTVLLINQGQAPIEVTPKFVEIDQETISKLGDQPVLIAAGHYHECEHSMAKDLQTRTSFEVKVILEYQDQMVEIPSTAPRLSVEALKEKYPLHKEA